MRRNQQPHHEPPLHRLNESQWALITSNVMEVNAALRTIKTYECHRAAKIFAPEVGSVILIYSVFVGLPPNWNIASHPCLSKNFAVTFHESLKQGINGAWGRLEK